MSEQNQPSVENEQVRTSGGAPLVERSMLFDFMVLAQPGADESSPDDERKDETREVSEEAPVVEFSGEPQRDSLSDTAIKSSFELDEHLKMLCDTELIAQIQSIPKRISFKIGEVADLVGVKSFVLRFWETEFDLLKPKKASNNQRMYSKKDVEVSFLIKKLLYRDRFSIEGARNVIKQARLQMKTEVSKFQEASVAKQKMESLSKLQAEKLGKPQDKSIAAETPVVDQLTIEEICENVDQISNRLSRLKELLS